MYEDITYEVDGPAAVITMNRPQRYNAFRGKTVEEMIKAFRAAWADQQVQAIVLTGAGENAFCTGGDVKQRAETGDYGPTESGMFEIGYLHKLIRDVPKPVIAAVNGLAIGGGHVLHVLCDVTIAADTARFGQSGPKVGSFDAGFGSAYLARVVGEKRAREIWFWCRQYDAQQAERMGLVNAVLPPEELLPHSLAYARMLATEVSSASLAATKAQLYADWHRDVGTSVAESERLLEQMVQGPDFAEGARALAEKRPPDFRG